MPLTALRRRVAREPAALLELALLALLGLVLLPGVALAARDLVPIPPQVDFTTYYLAARALAEGASPYDQATLNRLAA
ncbi:MAG TPA: hypothetical protein PKD53_32550, partial [Chloroflexaceae bacterium]|nr:hypothetical protein [Chloroflexaceae bacterium]